MDTTVQSILDFVEENDVKFIRLGFCDLFGMHKNIAITTNELEEAFLDGVSFDASSIDGFLDVHESDLFLFPDPATFTMLPWRPESGRVIQFFCNIKNPDGTPFVGDARALLKQAIHRMELQNLQCKIGIESEFYLFKTDEFGVPTNTPIDRGGYFDISPLDKGQDIRKEICYHLEELGLQVESTHHEQGYGQNEIDFRFSDPLTSADNLLIFKSVVKTVAEKNGLFASFMPKPLLTQSGSGLHINLSISRNGKNLFQQETKEEIALVESFIQGILRNISDLTLFLNSVPNSYDRLGEDKAPRYISWSHQNRSQLVRIPASKKEKQRMELRSADSAINPYLAFALLLHAGMDGIEEGLQLTSPVNENLYSATEDVTKELQKIPQTLEKAVAIAKQSTFNQTHLNPFVLQKFLAKKKEECTVYALAKDKTVLDQELYFPVL
ncbi:MAG: glutamine synthetase family protein [Bacillota bacterium]